MTTAETIRAQITHIQAVAEAASRMTDEELTAPEAQPMRAALALADAQLGVGYETVEARAQAMERQVA